MRSIMTVTKIVCNIISIIIIIQWISIHKNNKKMNQLHFHSNQIHKFPKSKQVQNILPIFNCCYWSVRVLSILHFIICIIIAIVQRFSVCADNMINRFYEWGHISYWSNWQINKLENCFYKILIKQIFTRMQQVYRMGFHLHYSLWFVAMYYRKLLTEANNLIRTSLVWFCNHCLAMIDHYPYNIYPCLSFPVCCLIQYILR